MLPRRTHSICLLAIAALVGSGCNDDAPSTAPTVLRTDAAFAIASVKPRPRTVYIADVQLSTLNIPVSPSDEITPFTVTVTNPSPKDVPGISLEGELQPTFNNQPPPSTAFTASCPNPNGIVPRGDCTMSNWIGAAWNVTPGPGTFTLRLLQLQPDGTKKVLDTKVIDVTFVQY
jgi:hypothetical protein